MATKVFSVEQLRLNNELLSGDSLNRLWYADNQLAIGSTSVPVGFDIIAGAGLGGGGTMGGSNVTIDVNLLAADPGLRFAGTNSDFLQVHEIIDSHIKPLAGIGVTKLAASGITVNAGDGIAVTANGVFNLGQSQDLDVDLRVSDPGLGFSAGKLHASEIDNTHIKLLAGIDVTKISASGVDVLAGNGISTTANTINLGQSSTLSVDVDGSTLSVSAAGVKVESVPNSLSVGYGIDSTASYDGSAAVTISLDPAEAVLMTGDQSIAGHKSFDGTLHVHGNLVVDGTTTTVDSTTVNIGDNIIVLNNDATSTATSSDGGILIKRFTGGGNTAENASLLWHNTAGEWRVGVEGSEEPLARGKAFQVALGLNDNEETVNISAANFQSVPVVHATVKNTADYTLNVSQPDLISCMVVAVSATSVTVHLSAKPMTANYVLELICIA